MDRAPAARLGRRFIGRGFRAIPIKALCDLPGLGPLAWKAALGRDLPVLVSLTILIAAITQITNAASDLAILACGR